MTESTDFAELARNIKRWGQELGFQQVGITDTALDDVETRLQQWLEQDYHGEMQWMARHGTKRTRPAELVNGTQRIICVRMDYLPDEPDPKTILQDPHAAFISRYALGRDYHKVIRRRLQKLANRITQEVGCFGYRAFVDSAPVMEKPLAAKAGLGWVGKHTNLLNRKAGSWFFLGGLCTNLPLPMDSAATDHCGQCTACIDCCPTQAIVAPYQVDARRCISYLTIELAGSIPVALRPLIGNRIYGCDDCQQCCPWNRFAQPGEEPDFAPRQGLDNSTLLSLFTWTEQEFLQKTQGSAIRRIGHVRWLRNIAVALGNAVPEPAIYQALAQRISHPSALVVEHVQWAMQQHRYKSICQSPKFYENII